MTPEQEFEAAKAAKQREDSITALKGQLKIFRGFAREMNEHVQTASIAIVLFEVVDRLNKMDAKINAIWRRQSAEETNSGLIVPAGTL